MTARSVKRTGRLATLSAALMVLTTSGALVGCGAGVHPNAAAVIDEKTITESDLDDVSRDVAPLLQPGQNLSRQDILSSLILQPYVVQQLKSAGRMVSGEEAARQAYASLGANRGADSSIDVNGLAPATRDFWQFQASRSAMSQADVDKIVDNFSKARVEVNPKYGSFSLKDGVVPEKANWLEPVAPATPDSAPPAPTPTPTPAPAPAPTN